VIRLVQSYVGAGGTLIGKGQDLGCSVQIPHDTAAVPYNLPLELMIPQRKSSLMVSMRPLPQSPAGFASSPTMVMQAPKVSASMAQALYCCRVWRAYRS
jgi:hypothetical protein